MDKQTKKIYEKMVDLKHFAVVLLAVGVFFYLGVIIPSDLKTEMDLNIMMISCMSFLAFSLFLFIKAKQCQLKLMDMEDHKQR
ncbi:YrhC family protein [Neobacillus vireti]|uniref:YrhC family protein n=1 Tax=Neobacillus vireti TaxID=220686 RepID=UPI003000605B